MPLSEGQIGSGQSGSGIDYSGVTSCLTVTCLLDDGSYVGGHLSLLKVEKDSTEVLPAMKDLIGARKVTKVVVAGQLDTWNPAYFTKPLYDEEMKSNYLGEAPDTGQLHSADTSYAIANALGTDAPVTTESREGSFTITPS
jgi:hypothetical protein